MRYRSQPLLWGTGGNCGIRGGERIRSITPRAPRQATPHHTTSLLFSQVPTSGPASRVAMRVEIGLSEKITLGKEALDYQAAHGEDDRAWRQNFVVKKWGRGLGNKDYVRTIVSYSKR